MTKKIYLASSFELKNRVQKIAYILEQQGYEITREWWHKDYKEIDLPDDEWYEHEDVIKVANDNFDAIDEADIFILVCPPKEPIRMKGADIEFGYALSQGLKCYSVGKLMRSAMYQPLEKIDTLRDLKDKFQRKKIMMRDEIKETMDNQKSQ